MSAASRTSQSPPSACPRIRRISSNRNRSSSISAPFHRLRSRQSTRYATPSNVVSACAGATVSVQLTPPVGFGQLMLGELGGVSLDRLDLDIEIDEPDASLLSADAKQAPIDETVVSNLLKS